MTRWTIHSSRGAYLAPLRLVEKAKRRGLARGALALVARAMISERRLHGALGMAVRRRLH